MNTMFRELRAAGGQVARVVDPRSEHGCDDSRLMSLNFFDAVLSGETKPGALVDIETLQHRELTEYHLRRSRAGLDAECGFYQAVARVFGKRHAES